MPRVRYVGAPKPAATVEPDALAAFLGPPRKPKKKTVRGIGAIVFAQLLEETARMLAAGDFANAQGKHFVALYAELHFKVYGVAPGDLDAKARSYAAKLATDMLAGDFANDRSRMASFIAWSWSREKQAEEWRRANPALSKGGRMSWRAQFSRGKLTDYKVEEARKKASR